MTRNYELDSFLAEWGISLPHLAKIAGISQAALRRWRHFPQSEAPSESAETSLETFRAFLKEAATLDDDPAVWLEIRLVPGYTVTGLDLYCEGETAGLLQIIAGEPAVEVLDRAVRDWRTRFDSAYEVFEAADGFNSIRMKPGR